MKAFVINLASATARWKHMEEHLEARGLEVVRVPAVEGAALKLPVPEFAEGLFRRLHGRGTNLREIGCYLSHVEAWDAFLATGDSHAIICEDDLELAPDFVRVMGDCVARAEEWDVLRLSGLRTPPVAVLQKMEGGYELCLTLGRLKGAGAYLMSRKAAERLRAKLLPMCLPLDHAIDREWMYGLRAALVLPFPASQTDGRFPSSIQGSSTKRLGRRHRWLGTYPYQAWNELTRYAARSWQYVRSRVLAGRRRCCAA